MSLMTSSLRRILPGRISQSFRLRWVATGTAVTSEDGQFHVKGRVFLNLAPVVSSCLVLGTWIAICYGGTLTALAIRQKGK